MANQEIYELLMRLNPGSTATDVQRLLGQIASEFQKLRNEPIVDLDQIDQLKSRLNAAVSEGFKTSDIFAALPEQFKAALAGVDATSGKFLAEKATLLAREIDLAVAKATQRAAHNTSGKAYVTGADLGVTGELASKRLFQVTSETTPKAALEADKKLASALAARERAARANEAAEAKEAGAAQKLSEADARGRAAMLRREAADRRAAEAAEARAKADQLAYAKASFAQSQSIYGNALNEGRRAQTLQQFRDLQQLPYGSPDTATPLGRAQEQVNQASLAQAAASRRLADEQSKTTPSLTALRSAWNQERRASEQLAAAQLRVSKLSEAPPSGLLTQFGLGFRGKSGDPYAVQLGQAAKFSLLYGTAYKALFAFTQTLQATLQEGIQFQQAVTELHLATNQSVDASKDLANQLGQTAANAGFSPSEGALAGARSIGLYGASGSNAATQNAIARISTDVATKLAFNSGMQIQDVQTTLAAITNAFQLGYAGQSQIADLDAYFSHRFGVAPGQTVQSVAEAGSVAQQAGFSLEQTNAIAALLQGRTGQSADAVAGWMAQIFSRAGEGSLGNVAAKYGINPNETLQRQLAQLAKVYQSASPNQQNEIAAAFGRGKVQNAVSVLLGSFDEVSRAAKQSAKDVSEGGAKGAANAAFSERINNLGGQLQTLFSDFKEFANLLGQSGVLAGLGFAIEGLKKLVEAANNLLTAWNRLPSVIKDVVGGLALLALAMRTNAAFNAIGSLPGLSTGVLYNSAGATRMVTAAGSTVPLASRAGASAVGGAALASARAALPWAAAIAGLVALGELQGASSTLNESMKTASDALLASTDDLKTPDQWKNRAELLQKQADEMGIHGLWQNIYNGIGLGHAGSQIATARGKLADASAFDKAYADALAKQEAAATAGARTPLITAFDGTSLSASMQQMADAGLTAQQQFGVLRDSILATAAAADRARGSFDADTFSLGIANSIAQQQNSRVAKTPDKKGDVYKLPDVSFSGANYQDQVQAAVKALGIDTANLGAGDITKLTRDIVNRLSPKVGPEADATTKRLSQSFRAMYTKLVRTAIEGQTQDVRNLLQTTRALSGQEMAGFYASVNQNLTAALAALPTTDYSGRAATIRQRLATVRQRIAQNIAAGGRQTPQDIQEAQTLQNQLAEAEFAQLDNARKVAQQGTKDKATVAALGRKEIAQAVKIAARLNDQDLLAQVISRTGKAGVAIARATLQSLLNTAKAALETAQAEQRAYVDLQRANGATAYVLGLIKQYGGNQDQLKQATATVKQYQDLINSLGSDLSDGTSGLGDFSGSDVPGYKAPKTPNAQSAKDRVQKMLAIRASLRQLAIDTTDPLAEARVAVADALDRVKHAVDREDRLAAQVDLKKARADLEATKFSQRLQAVQTADDLGRISHLKYIHYLDNEKNRLESIKHRTYQQQQELDQIDGLLKAAGQEMEGQWNFGDIKLPTPYQVKRRVEELYGTAVNGPKGGEAWQPYNQAAGQRTTVVNNYINGADTAKVMQIIRDSVRGQVTTRTSTSRHR